MEFLCLLTPACLVLLIEYRRNSGKTFSNNIFIEMLRFGKWCMIINLSVIFIITYLLKIDGVTAEAFQSFPFASKYMIIAIILAILFSNVSLSLELVKKKSNK